MKDDPLGGPLHLDRPHIRRLEGRTLVCLVDGEHYPPVTKWAIDEIEEIGGDVLALVFLGGTEKVEEPLEALNMEGSEYEVYSEVKSGELPLGTISRAIDETSAEVVLDLSDEPIVDYRARFSIASAVLEKGATYMGADFVFTPPSQEEVLEKPSISIVGTGKRVGKTAVGVTVSRVLKDSPGFDPVVVCMGRGGPPEPDYLDFGGEDMTPESLVEFSESGGHAASDYWEDALLGQVPTLGCRRCGGGMAGNPFISNVLEGASILNDLDRNFVILEGSGSTLPPARTDGRIVVVGAGQPIEDILDFFGEYRLRTSDLAIVTMCEEPIANEAKVEEIRRGLRKINPEIEVALTVFRPEPLYDVAGKDVFLSTTAEGEILSKIKSHLEEEFECNVCGISNNLSKRGKLREDLDEGLQGCDTLLTEIKAASIDIAARKAKENGLGVVFLHNKPMLIGGTVGNLEEEIVSLCNEARGG